MSQNTNGLTKYQREAHGYQVQGVLGNWKCASLLFATIELEGRHGVGGWVGVSWTMGSKATPKDGIVTK